RNSQRYSHSFAPFSMEIAYHKTYPPRNLQPTAFKIKLLISFRKNIEIPGLPPVFSMVIIILDKKQKRKCVQTDFNLIFFVFLLNSLFFFLN
ncbi:MAG: hypothetical protein IJV46_04140, partial [Acidaminococcaceae bacterium]|nr:hypothetical protein [Acidaminococcaceae bacterium]